MFYKTQALKVVKFLLAKSSFKLTDASKETGVAIGYVHEIIERLRKKFVVSSSGEVVLSEPRRLLLTLAAESSMAERLYSTYEFPAKKEQIEYLIATEFGQLNYAFTLLSAVDPNTAQGQQISIYVDKQSMEKAAEILKKLGARESNIGNVQVFKGSEGILFDRKKVGDKYNVSFEQLLIDLYAYPPLLYLGQELLAAHEKRIEIDKEVKQVG